MGESVIPKTRLQLKSEKKIRIYDIEVRNNQIITTFGAPNWKPRRFIKTFKTSLEAQEFALQRIEDKLSEGFEYIKDGEVAEFPFSVIQKKLDALKAVKEEQNTTTKNGIPVRRRSDRKSKRKKRKLEDEKKEKIKVEQQEAPIENSMPQEEEVNVQSIDAKIFDRVDQQISEEPTKNLQEVVQITEEEDTMNIETEEREEEHDIRIHHKEEQQNEDNEISIEEMQEPIEEDKQELKQKFDSIQTEMIQDEETQKSDEHISQLLNEDTVEEESTIEDLNEEESQEILPEENEDLNEEAIQQNEEIEIIDEPNVQNSETHTTNESYFRCILL